MTLEEACELAKAIEGNSEFAVIAIGRFVMTDELTTESKKDLSWGISVVPLRDRTDRAVIHKESEWVDFAKAVGKPVKQPAKDKQKSKPVYEDEHQLELF
jgi:hypothetical protein